MGVDYIGTLMIVQLRSDS